MLTKLFGSKYHDILAEMSLNFDLEKFNRHLELISSQRIIQNYNILRITIKSL